MPTLPTLTINNQQVWDRVYAAFDGDPATYRAWLVARLKDEVQSRELAALREQAGAEQDARAAEIAAVLTDLAPTP